MSLKVSINTFYYPNTNKDFVNAHKSVMNHFGIKVNYYEQEIHHAQFMQDVLKSSDADVVGFLDIDCIPLTNTSVNEVIKFVAKNKSIAGNVQATNHLNPMSHLFIAPSCFFIWKPLYEALGSPTFFPTNHTDVAQYVCLVAEQNGVRMKALYPTHFEDEPEEGVWRLHNYGLYGVGTVFDGKFYHLYQSRFQKNVDRFIARCNQVVEGTFNTDGMFNCRDFDFGGRIACFPVETNMRKNIEEKI